MLYIVVRWSDDLARLASQTVSNRICFVDVVRHHPDLTSSTNTVAWWLRVDGGLPAVRTGPNDLGEGAGRPVALTMVANISDDRCQPVEEGEFNKKIMVYLIFSPKLAARLFDENDTSINLRPRDKTRLLFTEPLRLSRRSQFW